MKSDQVTCYIRAQLEYSGIFHVKAVLLVLTGQTVNSDTLLA